ncbi:MULTISPECIES: AAA family ATPase [unclassified Knoellia]|uniref:AAA family ATPase n=1 Tax=Knoellia altitudinis TaxID=3404795 RepID=UPI00360A7E65
MQGEVVVLSGPPGAGKSTVAAALARGYERSVHLHTDDFWHSITAGSIPPYLAEAHEQNETVLRVVAMAAFGYAEGGYTVVVDGVVGPWMLRHFELPLRHGRETVTHYVVLRPARHTTLARARARTGVDALTDEEPILAMWDRFADLGELERHVLDTTQHSADQTLALVSQGVRDGSFRLLPGRT